MRKFLMILPMVVLVAIGATNAHANSYTPTFTCTGTCTFTPTAPDVSFPSPTSIMETWNGFTFTLALAAADSPTDTYTWFDGINASFHGIAVIGVGITDVTTGDAPGGLGGVSYSGAAASDSGNLTFSPVPTPEPNSVALMLVGIGFLLVTRKRSASSLQQVS